jgi:hypothetical protein
MRSAWVVGRGAWTRSTGWSSARICAGWPSAPGAQPTAGGATATGPGPADGVGGRDAHAGPIARTPAISHTPVSRPRVARTSAPHVPMIAGAIAPRRRGPAAGGAGPSGLRPGIERHHAALLAGGLRAQHGIVDDTRWSTGARTPRRTRHRAGAPRTAGVRVGRRGGHVRGGATRAGTKQALQADRMAMSPPPAGKRREFCRPAA